MPEIRVSHFAIVGVIVVVIGCPLLVCLGVFNIPAFEVGGFKFAGFSTKEAKKLMDDTIDSGTGYTPAKNPTEAMDRFREAIHARKYKTASRYCTKDYHDMLQRAHPACSELGGKIDKVRDFGKNQGLLSDRLAILLNNLDPFPKNFGSGLPPVINKTGDKAVGAYKWEPVTKKPVPLDQLMQEMQNLDKEMYQTVLAPPLVFQKPIELIKEGEEWKLNIKTIPIWEGAVTTYMDRHKTYVTGLDAMIDMQTRGIYDNPNRFDEDVIAKLRLAKNH